MIFLCNNVPPLLLGRARFYVLIKSTKFQRDFTMNQLLTTNHMKLRLQVGKSMNYSIKRFPNNSYSKRQFLKNTEVLQASNKHKQSKLYDKSNLMHTCLHFVNSLSVKILAFIQSFHATCCKKNRSHSFDATCCKNKLKFQSLITWAQ